MERIERCKLCGMNLEEAGQEDFNLDIYVLRCERCREYEITWEAYQDIQDQSPFLQAAARQASESGSRPRRKGRGPAQSSFRKCSIVRPASRMMPPIVTASIGLPRGIVTKRGPSDMTMCLPWRITLKPAFSRARTARRWWTPGNFGTSDSHFHFADVGILQ